MKLVLERSRRQRGFSILEAALTLTMIVIFLSSILSTTVGLQNAFLQSQSVSDLNLRAQRALDRIVTLASQATTDDAQFGPLYPTGAPDDFYCLRFRLVTSIDPVTGEPVYDDNLVVYVLGDEDTGLTPCAGLIVGRGPDMATIYQNGRGSDNLLGTVDDEVNTLTNGVPVVELLVPPTFAPQTGDLFNVSVDGRLVTFTLRMNARDGRGNFILPNDLVLSERLALRQ